MSYKNVSAILSAARDDINRELANDPEASHHRLKIEADLNRLIEYLNLITGIGDSNPAQKIDPGPATTIGGQPIKRPPSPMTAEDLEPDQRKVEELRLRVETLWNTFVTSENKDILKEVDDTTIRGLAKKAKMKVTRDYPEKVKTLQFIDELKDAILMEKARIVAADEQRESMALFGDEDKLGSDDVTDDDINAAMNNLPKTKTKKGK